MLIDTFFALDEFFRERATWVMRSATWQVVREWKDSDGNYLWGENLMGGQPQILGRPVRIVESMPAIAAGAFPICVADFESFYTVVRIGDMKVTRDEVTTPGQLKLYARRRYCEIVTDFDAGNLVKIATS